MQFIPKGRTPAPTPSNLQGHRSVEKADHKARVGRPALLIRNLMQITIIGIYIISNMVSE